MKPRSPLATRSGIAMFLLLVILFTGCGGGSGGGSEKMPLDEQLGLGGDAILKRQANAENHIRTCMKRQGFDYVPVDPSAQRAVLVGSRGLSDEDFQKQYGYGITTLYEQRLTQASTGPNEQIRSALPAPERATYERTLHGEDPTATFAVALDTGDFSRLGGCTKQATDEVFGGTQFLSDLRAKLDAVDERILADARMVDAVNKWSRCMSAKGFELAKPDQVDVVLKQRLDAIVGPPDARRTDFDRTALGELQRDEVAMVNADVTCERQHITKVEQKVREEYEAEFRAQNADFLSKVPPP